METFWSLFCGIGFHNTRKIFGSSVTSVIDPSSCTNHALVISANILLLFLLFLNFIIRLSRSTRVPAHYQETSLLNIFSAVLNGGLGLAYASFGIWVLEENIRTTDTMLPLHWLLVQLFQGFTWLLLSLAMSLWGGHIGKANLRLLSILAFLLAGYLSILSTYEAILEKKVSIKHVLEILLFPGAIVLLVCCYKKHVLHGIDQNINTTSLYSPLNCDVDERGKIESQTNVTPLSEAAFLSKMLFWWLNPLMKKGKEVILKDEDIPQLRPVDQAESCYKAFMEQENRQKQSKSTTSSSLLWMLFLFQWKEILLSGFFALLKVVSVSATPLLLNAFIELSEGKEAFRHEGYILAFLLLTMKFLESLSQRQWYFRSRLVGLRIRSLLSATIYRKQQRLSNVAKIEHSAGEITNYVTVDAYRIGEFPYWFHQTWTTSLQICIALLILVRSVGLAAIASLIVIILTVLCNTPLAKLQLKFQSKLMVVQGERLKATTEALINMKVLKLYAWETYFKSSIENVRKQEYKWLSGVQMQKGYGAFVFWSSPVLVSAVTLMVCYILGVPLYASNVFTVLATLRLLQDPISTIPDVIGVTIQARVALARIEKFLEAPELKSGIVRQKKNFNMELQHHIYMKSVDLSWEETQSKPTLKNINLEIQPGEKVAICGEVGCGKSTLLTAILGEVPYIEGTVRVYGNIAYVSQTAWIQTGTIRDNILFGSDMDELRYKETLEKCSLVKDLEMLPFGDLTEIGEKGVNLSGGQKQRLQIARALYQDADIYLFDDPFSAIDVHTATSVFNGIMVALTGKTVLLVTHQVDCLPAFNRVLLMSDGKILHAAHYNQLLTCSHEFQILVSVHRNTTGFDRYEKLAPSRGTTEIKSTFNEKQFKASPQDQLIKQEERETGDTGLKPYLQYLGQNKGFLYFCLSILCHLVFLTGLILQNSWMAAKVDDARINDFKLIIVYFVIGCISVSFLLVRSLLITAMGILSSRSLFTELMNSLFSAPISFYEATPLGRILSRVSSDLSIIDLDIPFKLMFTAGPTLNTLVNLLVVVTITWQVLFIAIPMAYLFTRLQDYYFACAKELMRINGTTKSMVANHLTESIAGAMTIRAFKKEGRFFAKSLDLIDANATPFFHNFAANEWVIQRIELMAAVVLTSSVLVMVLLPQGTFSPGFVGMALSYGFPLSGSLITSIQNHCILANYIVSVERINQYTQLPSEKTETTESLLAVANWPSSGRVDFYDLKVRYRPDTPLVLQGISCTIEGGHKIGIVGRTGSGKTTLISALFRLVEPTGGKILVDGIDIAAVDLHNLRSRLGIIPQDPTLFNGSVRYNMDPLSQHSDQEILEVLEKCQLREATQSKEAGLDSLVADDGSNWSMGQRQLFCLGRVLLRKSRILILDEATASIDNTTDSILQKIIRKEFADCTVITVAHRIPTVMDCTKVLSISDGKLIEYDEPLKLMKTKNSLFGLLVKEYWSQNHSAASGELN